MFKKHAGAFIPWRVKVFLSDHFPTIYHMARNFSLNGNSQEHWDEQLARSWDDPKREWPTQNEIILKNTDANGRIIDIACGNGSALRFLQHKGYTNLSGLEISDYAIKRLQADGIKMYKGVIPELNLPDSSFDTVILSHVLEHVIKRKKFMNEINRILAPGGKAFIFVPDNCMGPVEEKEHVIKYTCSELETFLSRYFRVLRVESVKDANHVDPSICAIVIKNLGEGEETF